MLGARQSMTSYNRAMTNSAKQIVFKRTIERYRVQIHDESFNGIKLQEIDAGLDEPNLHAALKDLVTERKLDVISSETQLNPHIKWHPTREPKIQLQYLDVKERYHTCLYPTPEVISEEYDLAFLDSKPFSQQLAQGHPQLQPIFFEIGVLDRYRLDPRYDFHCSEYAGRLSMSSLDHKTEHVAERDQTFLETFGLGIDCN